MCRKLNYKHNNNIYFFFSKKFRAAWRRICGKDNPNTTVNETSVNQLSESSSRFPIECSFTTFDKKKKRLKSKLAKKTIVLNNQSVKNVDETCTNSLNNTIIFETHVKIDKDIKYPFEKHPFAFANNIPRGEADCEMKMFSSEVNSCGKAINKVIEANTFKSNLF